MLNSLALMTSSLPPNGLSRRTIRCLLKAGIPINKQGIIRALKTGRIYPFHWPPNYGKYTHVDVCRWAGIDEKTLSSPPHEGDVTPFPDIGISYRAWRCLRRSGIPTTKKAVRHALRTGALSPGKRPSNYGPQTHAELCCWASVDQHHLPLPSKALKRIGKSPMCPTKHKDSHSGAESLNY
jgi:hypothetical protein